MATKFLKQKSKYEKFTDEQTGTQTKRSRKKGDKESLLESSDQISKNCTQNPLKIIKKSF